MAAEARKASSGRILTQCDGPDLEIHPPAKIRTPENPK